MQAKKAAEGRRPKNGKKGTADRSEHKRKKKLDVRFLFA
jgi:hypothetical protein